MKHADFNIKNDNTYKLGVNAGFFIEFLLFASVFYLILNMLKKLPSIIKYYQVVLFVIIVYFIVYILLKLKK